VRFTAGAAAAGRWSDVVEPAPNLPWVADDETLSPDIGFFPVADDVARDAGLRLTTPGWLLGFLVYLLLAGPVTWLVLGAVKRPAGPAPPSSGWCRPTTSSRCCSVAGAGPASSGEDAPSPIFGSLWSR
jgi:hypothetical protein